MITATAAYAATASVATNGLGSGLGGGNWSKNSHSKLILCRFLPNSCPHTFHLNSSKEDLLLVGFVWLVELVKTFNVVCSPILAFKPNPKSDKKLESFTVVSSDME